ncbi:hypothetical protein HRbin39_00898 [bacterium HR39]|nr:hypothetical protein HRbin39_00898 [bacterium HR39]
MRWPDAARFLRALRRFLVADETGLLADHGRVGHYTLAVTRWVAVVGQLFAVLFVHFSLEIPLPLAWLLPAIALSIALNLALGLLLGWPTLLAERAVGVLLSFDVLQLA